MGLDVDRFEGEVEESLICSLCSKVLDNPVAAKCGHTFCSPCIEKAAKRSSDCPKCAAVLTANTSPADADLVEKLGKLSIHCTSGCDTVVSFEKLVEHTAKECPFRTVPCENKSCDVKCGLNELESHMEKCDYRLVECKVCKACLPRKDMAAHQAIKRCFEQLNKRRMVSSARRLSQELREHRVDLQHQRHLTDQTERRILREHYDREIVNPSRRRTMSAGPVLLRGSIQARIGSALVVPHYSRNLKSAATLESCFQCSNRFLSGRRPSARRHSHAKVSQNQLIATVYITCSPFSAQRPNH